MKTEKGKHLIEVRGALRSSRGVSRTSELCLADGRCATAKGGEHFIHRWAVALMVLLLVAGWRQVAQSQSWERIQAHESGITAIAISPDGKQLATAGDENRIKVWEVATGALKQTLAGHSDKINSLAFNFSGQSLASAADDKTVKIWDVAGGRELRTLNGHSGRVGSVSYSPDGKWLASGSNDHTVRVWEAASGELLTTLRGHEDSVTSVAFSPDGKLLATASWDKLIKLWDVATWKERRKLAGHKDLTFVTKRQPGEMSIEIVPAGIYAIAFSPDGQLLASVSNDRTLVVWQVANGKELWKPDPRVTIFVNGSFVNRVPFTAVAFSPDGKFLAVGTEYGPLTRKLGSSNFGWHKELKDSTSVFTFGPDGNLLVACNDGTVSNHAPTSWQAFPFDRPPWN